MDWENVQTVLNYISGPIIGAIIGYITNFIAVKMLFYPRNEVKVCGHKVPFTPGAIPKGKPRLAKTAGTIIANTLLTEEDIKQKVLSPETEEGDRFGVGLYSGYTHMLSRHFNLEFGLGLWTGMSIYNKYSCQVCGLTVQSGRKYFLLPDDLMISIVYVF